MKKISHVIEITVLIIFNFFVLLLPLKLALRIGRWLGDIAFYVLKIRRDVVIKNLSFAFPNKTYDEIYGIAHRTYRNFGMSMIELLFFPKLVITDLNKNIEFEGLECLDNFLMKKQGMVLIAGHFGSWELMGAATCNKGYPLDFLVGKQHNIYVDNLLNFYRRLKNIGIIPLKMALKNVVKALNNGRFVAMIADQDAGKRDGVFVNFFGKPASTPKGPAVFALHSDIPVAMGFCIRQESCIKHKIKFVPVDFKKTGDNEKDIELLTLKYTQILEGFIKKYPDHWFWFHKRWKTVIDNTENMY
ncbi:MAG: lysophospholipid acyltransferase family protein [Elusimicrobia bacterium]|nr:lysophospholipid acyltransferase family protein [Elusimicrobiota bacterium]